MATTFTDNTYTYEGQDSLEWFSKFLIEAPSVQFMQDAGSIHPGVKTAVNVPSVNVGNSITAASCEFTPTGTITVATKKLTVVPLAVNKSICEDDIEAIMMSARMKAGSNNEDFLPKDFADALLANQEDEIRAEMEEMIWMGDSAGSTGTYLDEMDGFIKLMLADATVIDVANTTLTAANIQTELAKVVAAIPKTLKKRKTRPTMGIIMGINAAELYVQSLTTGFTRPNEDMTNLRYNGYNIFVVDGLADDLMVAADWKNLWFGTDVAAEMGAIEVLPMRKTTGSRSTRIIAYFKAGVQFGTGSEIVLYS